MPEALDFFVLTFTEIKLATCFDNQEHLISEQMLKNVKAYYK